MQATVYYTPRCNNCLRFIGNLQRSPSARQAVAVVDVDETPVRGIDYVPAVVLTTGQMYVGTKAFEWLRQHATDTALEPANAGAGSLAFSEVYGLGHVRYYESFSQFVKPE